MSVHTQGITHPNCRQDGNTCQSTASTVYVQSLKLNTELCIAVLAKPNGQLQHCNVHDSGCHLGESANIGTPLCLLCLCGFRLPYM